jgi:hypothetical protein
MYIDLDLMRSLVRVAWIMLSADPGRLFPRVFIYTWWWRLHWGCNYYLSVVTHGNWYRRARARKPVVFGGDGALSRLALLLRSTSAPS